MQDTSPSDICRSWWTQPQKQAHGDVFSLVQFIRKAQKGRRAANVLHMRIVTGDDPAGRGPNASYFQARGPSQGGERSRYFLCTSLVDTAQSLIASAKPTTAILTQGGDWDMQQRARKASRGVEGQLRQLGIEQLGPQWFRDAATNDIGALYGYLDDETGKPVVERVLPNAVLVDHNEALNSAPRCMYLVRFVDRARLQELFPKKRKLLTGACGPNNEDRVDYFLSRDTAADLVIVVDAWRLGSEKIPGRHIMCTDNATLADDEYCYDDFPIIPLRYEERPLGWYGQSLVERTKESQRRVNQLIRKYERCQDLVSRPIVGIPRSSGLTPEQISNLPGECFPINGEAPFYAMWSGTPPDLRAEIPAIREETLNNEGLSPQQVQGEKIAGVNSAVGLQAADDIQSRRHIIKQRRYEDAHVALTRLLFRLNDEAAERDPEYTITASAKRGRTDYIARIKWTDVQLDLDDVRIQAYPTSSLPSTPKGRIDSVVGLMQAGLLSQQQALEMMNMPDLDSEMRELLADVDYARHLVDEVIEGENEVYPDPAVGVPTLALCLETARKAYMQASIAEAPEPVMQDLRDWMTALANKITELQPPPAPAPMPMGPMMGDPMAQGLPPEAAMAAQLPPQPMGMA